MLCASNMLYARLPSTSWHRIPCPPYLTNDPNKEKPKGTQRTIPLQSYRHHSHVHVHPKGLCTLGARAAYFRRSPTTLEGGATKLC